MTTAPDVMSRGEREDLSKLVRQRERVAKTAAKARSAQLLADFAQQLATEYDPVDVGCDAIVNEARAKIAAITAEAKTAIEAELQARGIPNKFRPEFGSFSYWRNRDENATAGRRVKLLRVAQTAIAASEKSAISTVETRSLELQERLIAGGLRSAEARQFLASMPRVEDLMPALSLASVQTFFSEPTGSSPALLAERGQEP